MSETPATLPKKRRWRRWLVGLLAAVFVLVTVGVISVRLYYNDKRLTALIQRLVSENVPFPVTIGSVHLSLFSGVELTNIRVGPPNPSYHDDVLTIESVGLHYALAPLLERKLDVRAVTVVAPHATLEMQNGVWNAVALGNAFPPSAPKPAPAPEHAAELPISIALEHLDVSRIVADVHAPQMTAHLDGVSLSASGLLAGKGGSGAAEMHADGAFAFAQPGLGDAAGHLALLLAVKAPTFKEAAVSWSIVVSDMRGTIAGAALPALPLTLRGQASADLLKQTALVEHLDVALGQALTLAMKVSASEILGDPLLDISFLTLHADLAPLLVLAPPGRVPIKARGTVDIDSKVKGRLSDLKAQRNFTTDTKVAWHELTAQHAQGTITGSAGSVVVHVPEKGPLTVGFDSHSASVSSAQGSASDLELHADVEAPLSVLALGLDEPLSAAVRARIGAADAQGQHAQDIALTTHAQLFDFSGSHAKVGLVLDVGEARVQAAGGTIAVPVHVDLAAERTGSAIALDHLLVAVGSLIHLEAKGTTLQTPAGPKVDLQAKLAEMDLAQVLALVPVKARPTGLSMKGKLKAELAIKGTIPPTLAAQMSGDPMRLVEHVTPFDLTMAATWNEITLVQPGTHVAGACGSLRVMTGPQKAAVRFEGDAGLMEAAGATINNLRYRLALDDHAGEMALTMHASVGSLAKPDVLSISLEDSTFDTEVTFGRDAELKSLTFAAPSLGMRVTAHGQLQRADTFLREKQWQDPALSGVHAAFGMRFDLGPKAALQPLAAQKIALSGAMALAADVVVSDSLARITGALSTQKLSVDMGDAQLTNMSGTMPFTQSVKLGAEKKPVWSEQDIFKQNPRIAYYDDLRSYGRDASGLTIGQLKQGRYAIDRISFNGRYSDGMLLIDHFGASLLAGDVAGQLAMQFGADKTFRLGLSSTFSGVDLSVLGKTKPGPDSQVNGNASLELTWGERTRNVDGAFNLTRLGRELLIEALRATDPEDKDEKTRSKIKSLQRFQIKIDLLEVWIKNNNVNANLFYSLILTKLTLGLYKPINNDLVRRLNLGPRLDALAPELDPLLGPLLGWSKARSGAALK